MKANNFVFYGSNMETLERLKSQPELRSLLLDAILEYGCYGEYDTSNALVNALMANIEFGIDKAQDRYEIARNEGAKSHGNTKFSHQQIVDLHLKGMKNREIAETLGCDPKTVQRHLRQARDEGILSPADAVVKTEGDIKSGHMSSKIDFKF